MATEFREALSDARSKAWTAPDPDLPKSLPGRQRVDHRRVISWTLHTYSGGSVAGAMCQPSTGLPRRPMIAISARVGRGIWKGIFTNKAATGAVLDEPMLESSMVKAHRLDAGGVLRVRKTSNDVLSGERKMGRGDRCLAVGMSHGRPQHQPPLLGQCSWPDHRP